MARAGAIVPVIGVRAMLRDASSLERFIRFGRVRLLAAAWVSVCACTSGATHQPGESECTYGPQCETGDAKKDYYEDNVTPASETDGSTAQSNPLCGDDTKACDPDDAAACPSNVDRSGDAAAGQGNSVSPGSTLDAGAAWSCQVQASPTGQKAACAPAGSGTNGSPCLSGADCAPGFACVEAAGAAQCRRFCCKAPESCEPGTYCAERALRYGDGVTLSAVRVPVCVTPVTCRLDEAYPCPEGATCLCQPGTACTVVRADGTTDCVPPGDSLQGGACPCAAGHICSQGTDTCLKICKTNLDVSPCTDQDMCCTQGLCQASKSLPEGYGLCVGETADAG